MPDPLFPTTELDRLPVLVDTDPLKVAVPMDAGLKLGVPPESVPMEKLEADNVVKLNQLRREFQNIDDFPATKRILLESKEAPLFRDHVTPLKLYEMAVEAGRDKRPDLPWIEGVAASVRSRQREAAMIAGAIPATIQRAMVGDADWWYAVGPDGIRREAEARQSFKESVAQSVVGGIAATVADPLSTLLPGAGFVAGRATVMGTKSALVGVTTATGKELSASAARAGMTGAAMATAAQTLVTTLANRSQQKLTDNGTPLLTPSDWAWASVEALSIGLLEKKFGAIQALAGFRPQGSIGDVVTKDIVLGGVNEGLQGGVSAITTAGMEGNNQVTFGEVFAAAGMEGLAGAAIGSLNLPFAAREATGRIMANATKAAQDVTKLEELAQAAESHAHIVRNSTPEAIRAINAALGEDKSRSLYFSQDSWNKFWADKNTDPNERARALGTKTDDGTINVPLGKFVMGLVDDRATFEALYDIARASPDSYDLSEAADAIEQAPKLVEEIRSKLIEQAKTIHGGVVDDSGLIAEKVANQIKSSGAAKSVKVAADPAGKMTAAFYHTLANDLNRELGTKYTPHDLFEKYGFAIGKNVPLGAKGGYSGREIGFANLSDASTVVHEVGHHFIDVRSALAAGGEGGPAFAAETADFAKWIGDNADQVVSSYLAGFTTSTDAKAALDKLGGAKFIRENAGRLHELGKSDETAHAWRAIHEYFARGWEAYVAENKAPTEEMRSVFRKFTTWLAKVYKVASQLLGDKLRVTLSPEARRYMDRLLVTDAAVEAVSKQISFGAIIDEAVAQAKIPSASLQAAVARTESARAKVREVVIQDAIAAEKKATAKERKEVQKIIRNDMLSSEEGRAYRVLHILRDGKEPWGESHPGEFSGEKINRVGAYETAGKTIGEKLDAMGLLDEKGASPDVVATEFMFDDSSAMLGMIANLPPYSEREAEIMLEAFGNAPSEADIRLNVERQFAGPRRQEMIDAEMAVLISDYNLRDAKSDKLRARLDAEKAKAAEAMAESGASADRMLDWVSAQLKGKADDMRVELERRIREAKAQGRWDVAAENQKTQSAERMIEWVEAELSQKKTDALAKLREELTFKIRQAKEQGDWDVAAERKKADAKAKAEAEALAEARFYDRIFTENQKSTSIRKALVTASAEVTPARNLDSRELKGLAANHRRKARKAFVEGEVWQANRLLIDESNALFLAEAHDNLTERYEAARKGILAYGTSTQLRNELRGGAALVVRDANGFHFYETSEQVAAHLAKDQNAVGSTAVELVDTVIDVWSKADPSGKPVKVTEDTLDVLRQIEAGVKQVNRQTAAGRSESATQLANSLRNSVAWEAANPAFKPDGLADKAFGYIAGISARFSTYVNRVSGGKISKWHTDVLYEIQRTGVEARAMADDKTAKFNGIAKMTGLFDHVGGVYDRNAKKTPVEGTSYSASVQDRRALMLHFGNAEGRQRALEHIRLTSIENPSTVMEAILRTATKEDIAYCKAIWKQNAENKVEIDNVYRKIGDVPPKDVTPLPFEAGGVKLDGGYYTIEYDGAQTPTQEDLINLVTGKQDIHTSATPNQSLAKARAGVMEGRTLNLSPAVHTRHLAQVSDIVVKMEFAQRIQSVMAPGRKVFDTIAEKYGSEYANDMARSMWSAITGPPPAIGRLDAGIAAVRARVSAAGLMFNVVSMIKQPLGITSALTHKDINASALAGNFTRLLSDTKETVNFVRLKSKMMAERTKVWSDASRDAFSAINATPLGAAMAKAGMSGYAVMQGSIDIPTWITAYEGYLKKGMDDATAVQAADQLVRDVMGSGEESEMTSLHQNQWKRLLTVFGNYNITQLNLMMKAGQNLRADDYKTWLALAASMWWGVVVAAMANYAAEYALKGGKFGPKEGEGYTMWMTKQQLKAFADTTAMGRIVSDVAFAGGSHANIAAVRPLESAARLTRQTIKLASGEEIDGEQFGRALLGAGSIASPVAIPSAQLTKIVFGDDWRAKIAGQPFNVSR